MERMRLTNCDLSPDGTADIARSVIPSVKAYRGALPAGQPGIEFTTAIAPDPGSSTPYEARWYYPKTPGVELNRFRLDSGKDNEDRVGENRCHDIPQRHDIRAKRSNGSRWR